jgi:TP901 family phage tail tape measure protein
MAQAKALAGQIGMLNLAFNSLDKSAIKARNSMVEAFAANISSMGGFTTQMVNITSQTEKFGKALASNKMTMREYFAEAYRGYTRQSSMMRQLAREQVRFQEAIAVPVGRNAAGQMQGLMAVPTQVDFKNASTRMKLLSQEFGIFNQLVRNGADDLINMGKNTQWTGRQLTVGLTMPVVLFGAAFAKTFMDIDKQMTRFAKVYGQDVIGTSAAATEQMKKQVMDLAATISSQYGVAAKETVGLAADIAATGKEGQDLLDTVEQTNRLAVLGEVDRQEAMKATLAVQSAFKQNTNELAESINFLNAIENQTSTTLNDLVEAIPKAGPVVKGLGGSIQDLSVLMVAMKEGGIPAAEAANAIKSGLASLINPTKKASEVAKQFGVDLVGIVDANKGQLMPTLFAVQEALNGLDAFSRSKIIEEIFGKYQFARISALFNNLGKAGSQTQQAMELAGASTTELAAIANQELKAYTESTTVRFQRMVETVKNQLIPMGASLLEMLVPALEKLSGIIDVVKSGFENMPSFLKEPMKILAGAALIAGPVLMLVGLFKNLIGNSIKFGMSIVSLGARIGGINVQKFELLDAETAAASLQVDNLSQSFANQTGIVAGLNRELGKYLTQLRQTATTSPNMMVRPVPAPIRRARGSMGPEMVPGGFGGGDRIPALLEPGEFVMNKEATSKFGLILSAMNRGTIQGFQNGMEMGTAKGHIFSTVQSDMPGMYALIKRLQESESGVGVRNVSRQDAYKFSGGGNLGWHVDLWKNITQAENQLQTILSTRRNVGFFKQKAEEIIQDEKQRQRIMHAVETGAIQHEMDVSEYRRVLQSMAQDIESGIVPATKRAVRGQTTVTLRLREYLNQTLQQQQLAGVTNAEMQTAYNRYLSIFNSMRGQTDAVSLEVKNVLAQSLQRIRETMINTGIQVAELPNEVLTAIKVHSQQSSPSREAERVGKNLSDGFIIGADSVDGKPAGQRIAAEVTSGLIIPGRGATATGPIIDPRQMSLGPTVSTIYGPTGLPLRFSGASGETERIRRSVVDLGMPGMPQRTGSVADDERRSLMGSGAMNAMFGLSMAASTVTMFGDQTSAATQALSKFSMGLMAVSSLMMLMPSKMPTNLLGLGTLGGKVGAAGATRAAAGTTGLATSALVRGGAALSMLGGPVGIAAGVGITAAIAGFVMYKNAAEEARQRAISAFADPAKTAEYFGKSISDVTEIIKQNTLEVQTGLEDISEIDDALKEAVREDYAPLIERLKYSTATAGAQQLAIAFNKMVASGLSAQEAKDAVQAIAEEAGTAGGTAFGVAMKNEMLKKMTTGQMIENVVTLFSPSQNAGLANQMREELELIYPSSQPQEGAFAYGDSGIGLMPMNAALAQPGVFGNTDRARAINQMNSDILAMSDITSGQLVGITEQLFVLFEKAPEKAIDAFDRLAEEARKNGQIAFDPQPVKDFLTSIDKNAGDALGRFIGDSEEKSQAIMRAISAGITPGEIQQIITQGGIPALEVEVNFRVNTAALQNAVNAAKRQVQALVSEEGSMSKMLQQGQSRLDKLISNRDAGLKKFESGSEGMSEAFEQQQQAAEDEIKALEKEQEQIEKSADAYVDSIQKRQKADKFHADQRKSSMSALQSLAEGDVFAFLGARNEMQANAADYAYEQEIQRIEDRKSAETEAIQDAIDKKQEQMDLDQRAHDSAMKGIEDEKQAYIDAQNAKIEQQRINNNEMQTLIENIREEELASIKDIEKAFGTSEAFKYKTRIDNLLKETHALLQQQIIQRDITTQDATAELSSMYRDVFGSAGPMQDVFQYLGFPQFRKQPDIAPQNRASGGYISGPGGPKDDLIPAYLSNGEYVIRASSVERYGPEFFDAVNAGRFANGGRVGDPIGDKPPRLQDRSPFARFVQRKPLEKENRNRGNRGGRGSSGSGTTNNETFPTGTGGDAALNYARSQVGEPYVDTPPGARPPNSWDCTKLTAWAWAVATGADPSKGYDDDNAKVRLTPYSYTQVNEVARIGSQLDPKTWTTGGKAGDLLFFFKNGAHHASMYDGKGGIVEASSPSTGVRTESVFNSWNQQHFSSAGRPRGYANGGMIGSIPRKGIMPRYNLGGQVSMPSSNFSANSSMYNININANGVKDPAVVADIVIKRINSEKTRRQHSRVVS